MKYIIFKFRGFTLIEIIVVLVIITSIFAFSLPLYNKFQEKTTLSIAKSMLLNYIQELQSYNLKYGYLPNDQDEYQTFEKQMKLNPNNEPNNNKYYKIEYEKNINALVTVPQITNKFKSCITMDINTTKMQQCKCQIGNTQVQQCTPI